MKIGIKIFRYVKGIEEFAKFVDFIEIMAIEGEDYNLFESLGIPIVIHAQHQRSGVNNSDKTKNEKNISSINFAIELADKLNARKIIVHPGEIRSEDCSRENSVLFIKNIKDRRILVENMPKEDYLCCDAEETKKFLEETGKGFCFDVNHAIREELSLKKDYFEKIASFLELKPSHYHIGGQDSIGREHINFKYSEIDLKKIISLFPKDAEISIETSGDKDLEGLKEDVILLREVIDSVGAEN
ncbi:MAG: TIM barrel protein [Nanoarchaeota archaeon]